MSSMLVSLKDFRQNTPKYEKLVKHGVSLTILKRSKAIFRVEPVDTEFEEQITEALIDLESGKNFVSHEEVFNRKI